MDWRQPKKEFFLKIILTLVLLSFVAAVLFFYVITGSDQDIRDRHSVADSAIMDNVSPETAVDPMSAASSSPINLLFFGDLMLDRHIREKLQGRDLSLLLASLNDGGFFNDYDLVGANLEGAVTDGGEHYPPAMLYDFAFQPDYVAALRTYKFNFFNLANNHISDQGGRGLTETRENLDHLGFHYSGTKDGAVDSDSLSFVTINDKKIGLIGLSMVYNDFNLAKAQELVQGARLEADLLIVNIHWGVEYQHQFNQKQQQIGHALIDSGADLVIGHHPHVVQGWELYHNRPIFYSLGNFIFDQYFSVDTQEGLALGIVADSDYFKISVFPLRAKNAAVSLMSTTDSENFLKKFMSWSDNSTKEFDLLKISLIEIPR